MPWACTCCGTALEYNPDECPDCGHSVFNPVEAEAAGDRTAGIERPDAAEG